MFLFLSFILGSFAEEDIGRHGVTMQSLPGNASASKGLEVAVTNLQEYCNEDRRSNYSRSTVELQMSGGTTMETMGKGATGNDGDDGGRGRDVHCENVKRGN
ncbi:hypothetical protein L6452_13848 [Arctium lappa]|uniref:Uncharacterized protein n=1 Tax=Arctium lappa TaxID=4217 RepID=A0ACB9CJC7_ARCLA|nr:hypothetical protein L6452_13848 [Arctium lappa]